MCDECGCGETRPARPRRTGRLRPGSGQRILLEESVLGKNDRLAGENRERLQAAGILTLNLVSSPGSGKTRLLERTIRELAGEMDFFVIEGDQQTANDARRIEETGVPVLQINTGAGCHLDAAMVAGAIDQLRVRDGAVLMIENVGNLVCPAMFDLGESQRVVILSITEGEDKPEKYPYMFASADVCIINKMDLLPHLDFSIEKLKRSALTVNPRLAFIEHSDRTDGTAWFQWLREKKQACRPTPAPAVN